MHCISWATSHNWLRNDAAGAFAQPREMEMTCSSRKQRFFMFLPRVTRLFAATQSILLPRFVLFTFLRRQDATRKYSSLTDAICVLLLASSKDFLPPSLSQMSHLSKSHYQELRWPTSFFPWVIEIIFSMISLLQPQPQFILHIPRLSNSFIMSHSCGEPPIANHNNSVGSFHQLSSVIPSINMWKTLKLLVTPSINMWKTL